MNRLALLGVALLVSAGCAKGAWQRPGATEVEVRRDSVECDERAWVWEGSSRPDRQRTPWVLERHFKYAHFHECMEQRGYRWVREPG